MEFTNEGVPVKIRIGKPDNCYWNTIKTGESIELSKEVGLHLGFKIKTTDGKIGDLKVETKQIEVPEKQKQSVPENFLKELIKINGIGKKTAKDIIQLFPDSEDLKKHIQQNEKLPFRDDVEIKLREIYGK